MNESVPAGMSDDEIPREEPRGAGLAAGAPGGRRQLDARRASEFLRSVVRRQLQYADPDLLDDLSQIAFIRLWEYLGRSKADNLDALMNTIGQRTAKDYLRRLRIIRILFGQTLDQAMVESLAAPPADENLGDPLERFRFMVVEFFEMTGAPCGKLAAKFFAKISWKIVGETIGVAPNTIAKQWERCVTRLRAFVVANPGAFSEWAEEA
jgi:hypothetical protein